MINELQVLKTVTRILAREGIPYMNSEYIAEWVKKLGLTEIYKKATNE
ncbi:MAG: hypothetical protein V3U15_03355 [Nitrospinota bacterium]